MIWSQSITHKTLEQNPLIVEVLQKLDPILEKTELQVSGTGKTKESYRPDEYEFYLIHVGNRCAQLLRCCEQLENAISFLSSYRDNTSMIKAGVTRVKYLTFIVESYLIRTQTLYDITLGLVDAVFHLTNHVNQYKHAVIISNFKVARTKIPESLRRLRKHVSWLAEKRHEIVHRGTFRDDELDRIERYTIIEQEYGSSLRLNDGAEINITNFRKGSIKEFIKERKAIYKRFNNKAFQLLDSLLTELLEHFRNQEYRLKQLMG